MYYFKKYINIENVLMYGIVCFNFNEYILSVLTDNKINIFSHIIDVIYIMAMVR